MTSVSDLKFYIKKLRAKNASVVGQKSPKDPSAFPVIPRSLKICKGISIEKWAPVTRKHMKLLWLTWKRREYYEQS